MKTCEEQSETQKFDMVRFPDTLQKTPPPLRLEVEESPEGMSPRNVWQVYALGGFMILRWIWARWKERNAKDETSEEPALGDD